MGKYNPKLKGRRLEFRSKLKALIEEFGEWEVNGLLLSRQWGIPESTVSRWKHEILEEIGLIDISKAGRNIQLAVLSNLKLAQRLIRKAESVRDKVTAIKVHNETHKAFTEFLEAYGYKEKVAEKIIQETSLSWQDFNNAYAEILKSRKKKKKLT